MNKRINQIRKGAKLTQADFGKRIGISGAAVSRIESGENNPGDQTIKLICSEFGIRREWLELGHEPMYSKDSTSQPESLIPDLVEMLSNHPNVLIAFQRILGHMTPADWDRLNVLMDNVWDTTKKDPEA